MRKDFPFENASISYGSASIFSYRGVGGVITHVEEKSSLESKSVRFEIKLPLLTVSEANGLLSRDRFYKNGKAKPEHWTEKSARHKAQKQAIYLALNPFREKAQLPCVVRMTRFAPRELDADDNLRIALKWIKDAIAEVLTGDFLPGRADNDARIKWEYGQEKCKEYFVKIEVM